MSSDASAPSVAELIQSADTEQIENSDPEYVAWLEAKVRESIAYSDANPDSLSTIEEVRKRFGLDP